jgi:protein ImuA
MRLPGGGAVAPFFAPPPAPHLQQVQLQQERLEWLRTLLAALERRQNLDPAQAGMNTGASAQEAGWTLGAPEVDGWLPDRYLDAASLNEIKPEAYEDVPAALTFALLLAARRLGGSRSDDVALPPPSLAAPRPMPPAISSGLVVWCWPAWRAREFGGLYGPGLARLGLDPARVLLVETTTPAETLWAMEESIGSGAAAIVIGSLDAVALTPARRLALAAAAHRTPVLMVTAARPPAMPATFARWRIAAAPSAPHLFDVAAPGDPRFRLTLERCRGVAAGGVSPSFVVEWSHDAHRFRVVAGMADRASAAASRA